MWGEMVGFVDGKDRFLYGIPCDARRVVKFNPLDRRLFAKDAAEECDATLRKCFNLLKNAFPRMKNGLTLIATPFRYSWLQIRHVRILQHL
jgi:hypothetical protein